MRKNNNHKPKQYHGSSPPFQEGDRDPHEWEIGFKSMEQQSDESPYIQLLDQIGDQENESDDQESETRRYPGERTGQNSIDEDEF